MSLRTYCTRAPSSSGCVIFAQFQASSGVAAIKASCPATATNFTIRIRVPNRTWSGLYTPTPAVNGLTSIQLNGTPIAPVISNGYATITRTWTNGDKIDLVMPMAIQRLKASSQIAADVGRVALQFAINKAGKVTKLRLEELGK